MQFDFKKNKADGEQMSSKNRFNILTDTYRDVSHKLDKQVKESIDKKPALQTRSERAEN